MDDRLRQSVFSSDLTERLGLFVYSIEDLGPDGLALWLKDRGFPEAVAPARRLELDGAALLGRGSDPAWLQSRLGLTAAAAALLQQLLLVPQSEELQEDIVVYETHPSADASAPAEAADETADEDAEGEGPEASEEVLFEELPLGDDEEDALPPQRLLPQPADDPSEIASDQWDLSESTVSGADDACTLWQAAWDGNAELVERLLRHPADGDGPPDINALGYDAAGYGLVLSCGTYTSENPKKNKAVCAATALHFASAADQPEAVRVLLQHGADASVRLADGATAKHVARVNDNREVLTVFDCWQGTFDTRSPLYRDLVRRTSRTPDPERQQELARQLLSNVSQSPIRDRELRSEWAQYDTAGRGYISKQDLRRAYLTWDTFGVEETPSEIDEVLDRHTGLLDDGHVSFEEFAVLRLRVVQR